MLFSCKEKDNYSKIKNTSAKTANITHKIIIKKVIDAEKYTYLNVDENNTNYWMAIPSSKVKVGDTYYYNGGMVMNNFKSKQLKRNFDKIIFAEGVRYNEKYTPVKTHYNLNEKTDLKKEKPHANDENIAADTIKITKAKDGITLEELFKNQGSYANKSVMVRGVVIKVNNAILNKNWVHIVDGTRSDKRSSLTITTKEMVKKGDTLTFKGIIALKKDLGKGYVYPILLEDGQIIK